jgi:O-antigen ligase
VLNGLALFGVYLAATAIAERLGVPQLVFPSYISSPEHFEFLGRARGPFLNPVANGLFLTCGLCALLLAWPRCGKLARFCIAAAAGLFAVALYSTLTRSVWLGAMASLFLLAGLRLPRKWFLTLLGAATVVGCLVVATQWEDLKAFKRDKFVSVDDMQRSASLRPILATVAWQMFQDRPLFGCGLGRYQQACLEYVSQRQANMPLDVARDYVQHNVALALLAETGLIGAGLFLLLLAAWALDARQLQRGKLSIASELTAPTADAAAASQLALLSLTTLACYLVNGMFHDVSIMPMTNMLVFFLAGVVRNGLAARSE